MELQPVPGFFSRKFIIIGIITITLCGLILFFTGQLKPETEHDVPQEYMDSLDIIKPTDV